MLHSDVGELMVFIRRLRERGWQECSIDEYRQAYERFGGSVITHPGIISFMSEITEMPLRFLATHVDGVLCGAIPTWGKYIAGNKRLLKKAGKKRLVDIGNSEVVFPFHWQLRVRLRFVGDLISELHQKNILNLKRGRKIRFITLAKNYESGEFSRKFKYNKRREWRLLKEAGGSRFPIWKFNSDDIAYMYRTLFQKRWGSKPKGNERLDEVLFNLKKHLFGDVLFFKGDPIAIQIVYLVESKKWLSAEFVNGGFDPQFREYSPGSVLTFLNTFRAAEEAAEKGKNLRYSFGKLDRAYKLTWCNKVSVFSS